MGKLAYYKFQARNGAQYYYGGSEGDEMILGNYVIGFLLA
jgi:hypothetical protein